MAVKRMPLDVEIEAQSTASARELPEKARAIARELAEKILGRKLAA